MPDHPGALAVPSAGSPGIESLLARVLGLPDAAHVRGDTPLAGLGFDSLALLCLADLVAENGGGLNAASARGAITVDDLASCLDVAPGLSAERSADPSEGIMRVDP